MPFPYPRRPYTNTAVEALDEGQMGCYGLFRGERCIYVGKGDIRQRLLDHLNGDNPCINSKSPWEWAALVAPDYDAWEKELIVEYSPECNKRVG